MVNMALDEVSMLNRSAIHMLDDNVFVYCIQPASFAFSCRYCYQWNHSNEINLHISYDFIGKAEKKGKKIVHRI